MNKSNFIEDGADVVNKQREPKLKDLLVSISHWWRYLAARWVRLLIFAVMGAAIGFIVALFTPKTYNGSVRFILEEGKSGGGGLSALAGEFGLDLAGLSGSSSNLLAGDNIIGLLKSRRFTEEVLLSAYDAHKKYSLADKYAEAYQLREKWATDSKIGKEIFFPVQSNRQGYSRLQDSLLQVIEKEILTEQLGVQRSDKRMTFFEVSVNFRDELLAKLFVERLVNITRDFYVETKTRTMRANVDRLQRRADSLVYLLNNRSFAAAAAQSRSLDVNPAFQTAAVPAELIARDKVVAGTIYGEIVKNLEIQKVTLSQFTPVIQVVDSAELPLKVIKKSKLLTPIIGAIVMLIVGACFFTLKRLLTYK